MVCWRCYRLGYQITAAAPYTALNRGPIPCDVDKAAHVYDAHAPAYLPPSTVSFAPCWAGTTYYAHTIDGPSVLAPSPPTYLVGLNTAYIAYMYILFTLIQLWSVPEKSGTMTSTAL